MNSTYKQKVPYNLKAPWNLFGSIGPPIPWLAEVVPPRFALYVQAVPGVFGAEVQ